MDRISLEELVREISRTEPVLGDKSARLIEKCYNLMTGSNEKITRKMINQCKTKKEVQSYTGVERPLRVILKKLDETDADLYMLGRAVFMSEYCNSGMAGFSYNRISFISGKEAVSKFKDEYEQSHRYYREVECGRPGNSSWTDAFDRVNNPPKEVKHKFKKYQPMLRIYVYKQGIEPKLVTWLYLILSEQRLIVARGIELGRWIYDIESISIMVCNGRKALIGKTLDRLTSDARENEDTLKRYRYRRL